MMIVEFMKILWSIYICGVFFFGIMNAVIIADSLNKIEEELDQKPSALTLVLALIVSALSWPFLVCEALNRRDY